LLAEIRRGPAGHGIISLNHFHCEAVKPLFRFSLIFVGALALFLATRHSTQPLYQRFLTQVGSAVLGGESHDRVIRFASHPGALDSAIHLSNPNHQPVLEMILAFDSIGLGWTPSIFLLCLFAATPIPLKRKLGAGLVGALLLHLYILVCLWFYIQAHLGDVGLAQPSDGLKQVLGGIEDALIGQIGPGLFVPLICWAITSFRQADLTALFSMVNPRAA
jgi:hypothetical protein